MTPKRLITFMLAIMALGAVTATPTAAATNSQIRHQLAHDICGYPADWTVKRDKFGNYWGAVFQAHDHGDADNLPDDTLCRAPIHGRLDVIDDNDQIWSTRTTVRRIWVTKATYLRFGAHTNLTRTPLTPSQALNRLVNSATRGTATATRLQGSESTGWVIKVKNLDPNATDYVVFLSVYHGTVETPRHLYHQGQLPDPIAEGEQASFWYNG